MFTKGQELKVRKGHPHFSQKTGRFEFISRKLPSMVVISTSLDEDYDRPKTMIAVLVKDVEVAK